MKNITLLLFFVIVAGTLVYTDVGSGESVNGKAVFQQRGCGACHDATRDQSVLGLGPSFQQICEVYKGKDEDVSKFLKCESPPLVDKENYSTMHEQIVKMKGLSDAQLKALAEYICNME